MDSCPAAKPGLLALVVYNRGKNGGPQRVKAEGTCGDANFACQQWRSLSRHGKGLGQSGAHLLSQCVWLR